MIRHNKLLFTLLILGIVFIFAGSLLKLNEKPFDQAFLTGGLVALFSFVVLLVWQIIKHLSAQRG